MRADRLVELAPQTAADPSGSIPRQAVTWATPKPPIALFDRDEVTFEAVGQAHWDLRHRCGPGRFAIISDITEVNFGHRGRIAEAGPMSNGSRRGLMLHSALIVDASSQHLPCVAGAERCSRRPEQAG